MRPCRAFDEFFFSFFFGGGGNLGPLKTQKSQKLQKLKNLAKKKKNKKKNIRKRLVRGTPFTRVQSFRVSQKWRGHYALKEFGVLCLNQPVSITVRAIVQALPANGAYLLQEHLLRTKHPLPHTTDRHNNFCRHNIFADETSFTDEYFIAAIILLPTKHPLPTNILLPP